MNTLKLSEDEPLEAKMLSSTIESSQAKVEGRNFSSRKSVLQFDNVMNLQREKIYSQRQAVLDGEDLHQLIVNMMLGVMDSAVELYLNDEEDHSTWNIAGLREYLKGWVIRPNELSYTTEALQNTSKEDIRAFLHERVQILYANREKAWGEEITRELERMILLRNVDTQWMDHITAMDELKRGIYLRGYGQRDPVIEYQVEGSEMYDAMIETIRELTVKMLLTVKVQTEAPIRREQVAKPSEMQGEIAIQKQSQHKEKVGRNDPCPCGSGKKYKKCCGR